MLANPFGADAAEPVATRQPWVMIGVASGVTAAVVIAAIKFLF